MQTAGQPEQVVMSEFSKTLAIFGILAPLGAGAVGIGDICSHSALNQTLDAEIPLVLSGADKLDTIQVRLASPEAFDKAGVERLHALTQLRFRPVAKHGGRFVIQVSSNEVIQEPFLDFLVEVESPQGKLLREFTLLLDPPRGITQATTGQTGTADSSPPRHGSEFDIPAAYSPPPPPARMAPGHEEPYLQDEALPRSTSRPGISREQLTGQTYGPVRRRETLFDIANRIDRPPSVTAGQMATALYLANPGAFSGTIHGLLAGSMLRIPTEDFIASVGPEASEPAAPGRRARAWPQPAHDDPMARVQDWTTGHAAAAGRGDGEGAVSEVSSRVPAALKRENEALRERLTQLEQQLEEAQRMLALKNAELSSLRGQQVQALASEESMPLAEPVLPAANTAPPRASTPAGTSAPAASASAPPPVPSAPLPSTAALPPEPVTAAVQPAGSPPEASPMAPGYWLASVGLLALGLGAWLFHRRHDWKAAEADGLPRKGRAPAPNAETIPASPRGFTASVPEPSDPDLDTSTLDPQWEANVYLRYGRYTQAESLIRAAISQAPEQHDLKLKLFEILKHANNPDAFRAYALDVWGDATNLPVTFWSTVRAMRPEWLPPEIVNEGRPVVHPANPAVAPSLSPDPSAREAAETETLDIEDTDFTAELRVLEAQYSGPEPPRPDEETVSVVPAPAMAPVPELGGLAVDATDGPAFTPPAPATPAASGGVMAPPSGPASLLPADLLDESDTDFSEELRALEAQYEKIAADRGSAEESVLPVRRLSGAQEHAGGESRETRLDKGNLLEFAPSAAPDSGTSGGEASSPDHPEWTPDNLIPFDTAGLPPVIGAVPSGPASDRAGDAVRTRARAATEPNDFPTERPAVPPVSTAGDTPFGALDFDLDLFDPGPPATPLVEVSVPGVSSSCEENLAVAIPALLARARAFADQDDKASAREALQTVLRDGNSVQKAAAETLLNELGKVRLSLVPLSSRGGPADAGALPLLPKVKPGI